MARKLTMFKFTESLNAKIKTTYYKNVAPSTESNDIQLHIDSTFDIFDEMREELKAKDYHETVRPHEWRLPFSELTITGDGKATVWYAPPRKTRFLPDMLGGPTFTIWKNDDFEWLTHKNLYESDVIPLVDRLIIKDLTITEIEDVISNMERLYAAMDVRYQLFKNNKLLSPRYDDLKNEYNRQYQALKQKHANSIRLDID